MSRVGLFAVLILAGSIAPCQDTFIVHFDSVQNGYDALQGPRCREVLADQGGILPMQQNRRDKGCEEERTHCGEVRGGGAKRAGWTNCLNVSQPFVAVLSSDPEPIAWRPATEFTTGRCMLLPPWGGALTALRIDQGRLKASL